MGRPRKGWSLRKPRRPGDSYAVRFTSATGQPRELSTGTRDPREASRVAAELYARDLTRGPDAPPGVPTVDPLLSLTDLFARYLLAIETTHDPETVKTYVGYAKRFVGFFGDTLATVTAARMGVYQRERLGQVLRGTVRKERSFLSTFLAWCVEQHVLGEAHVPAWPKLPRKALGVRSGKQRAKPVDVTVADVAAFLAALPLWSRSRRGARFAVRARFAVAYETGLRPATLDAISIPEHWTPGAAELEIAPEIDKARFGRRVPLTPFARAALEHTVRELGITAGLVFGEHDYRAPVEKARKAAGLPAGFAPYDLRHGRASHLLDASADLRGTGFVLGHKLMTTTNRYIRPDEKGARAALAAASSGGIPGEYEGKMVSAKEGSRTLTGVTPLEPESTGTVVVPNASEGFEGAERQPEAGSGAGFGGSPETPPALSGAAKYLAALRSEWDLFDDLSFREGES